MTVEQIKNSLKEKKEIFFLSQAGIMSDLVKRVVEVTEIGQPDSVLVYTASSGITGYGLKDVFDSKEALIESLSKDAEKPKPDALKPDALKEKPAGKT